MTSLSSLFLVLSLVLAVVIGPQTRSWTWGPAMISLGLATALAIPGLWTRNRSTDFKLIALCVLVAGWFAWRAWFSPVAELATADLLLLAGAVGSFISIRGIIGNRTAEKILIWGVALLLLANVVVVARQVMTPAFTPVFEARAASLPAGFFAHYNECANYLIASSLLVGAAAFLSNDGRTSRVIWAVIAIAGLVAVYFTRSRGGLLGAVVGCGVFACMALAIGKQTRAKWFAPALIAIPIIGIVLATSLFLGWRETQEFRNQGNSVVGMFDNTARLFFLGVAFSCIGLHPLIGGGSRSFSWESFRFLDRDLHGGALSHTPEQVHNELLQAFTDYGIIGAILLIALLGTLIVISVYRSLFSDDLEEKRDTASLWYLGGFAGLAGMFVQSSFSFVFHLFPGVILLGLCLGQMSHGLSRGSKFQFHATRLLLSVGALASLTVLLPFGWKGARVTFFLWDSYLTKPSSLSVESKVETLTHAIRVWPQSTFFTDRAANYRSMASSPDSVNPSDLIEKALHDYQAAEILHPFNPAISVNHANLLSHVKRDAEAEKTFNRAIQLQGGMEPAFRARFSKANHLLSKGTQIYKSGDHRAALPVLEAAAEDMEQAAKEMHWIVEDMRTRRVRVHESLGIARETNGDLMGALNSYNFASGLYLGDRAHYRAGVALGKIAASSWAARRPSDALSQFIEAKRRIQITPEVPGGVTLSQRVEYLAYLDKMIQFLKSAKVDPAPLRF